MLKIYANGKELREFRITQDENGPYHKGLTGLVVMGGGLQQALDFGIGQDYVITANQDCKVILKNSNLGNYIAVDFGTYQVCFVHVYKHASGTIKAGQPICSIAPTALNGGYAVHLHIYATKNKQSYLVRNLVFAEEKPKYNVGDWVEFTAVTNLRAEPAGHKGALADVGERYKIVSAPVRKEMTGVMYDWYQGVNTLLNVYWFFDGNIKKTEAPNYADYNKLLESVKILEAKLKEADSMATALKESNEELLKEAEKLQNDKLSALDMYDKKKKELEDTQKDLDSCRDELKKIKDTCNTRVAEAEKKRLATLLATRPIAEQIVAVLSNLLNKLFSKKN